MNARTLAPVLDGWEDFDEWQDDQMKAVAGEYLWQSVQELLLAKTEEELRIAQMKVRSSCMKKFREDV